MKRQLLTFSTLFLLGNVNSYAQNKNESNPYLSGKWNLNLNGGLSLPMGTYKSEAFAKPGPWAGISIDKYFKRNHIGIGLDARYLSHKQDMNPSDYNYQFANGKIVFQQDGNKFNHMAIGIGPTFKGYGKKFEVEGFIRSGILMQKYPAFNTKIYATNPFTGNDLLLLQPFESINTDNKPSSLMGIIGGRFTYMFTPNIGVSFTADYLSAFGEKGKYSIQSHKKLKDIPADPGIVFEEPKEDKENPPNNIYDYYDKNPTISKHLINSLNVGVGLKFTFGNNNSDADGGATSDKSKGKGENDIIVVVKDQKTQFPLSGVKVTLRDANGVAFTGITDANGQIKTHLHRGAYTVLGDKNNVATTNEKISVEDFSRANIYKEIYHNDERFTLKGQTIDCNSGKPLGNIATSLTHENGVEIISQTSDPEGNFVYQLNPNSTYNIVANQYGKYSQTELVTTKGLDRAQTLYVTLKLGVCDVKEGMNFVLKNIFYDYDQSFIRPDAAIVLNNLVSMMKQNPNMRIELTAHTDARGDASYNLSLSQKRADAAIQYLVSKGINRNRLSAKGFGESTLTNGCKDGVKCSEEQHAENRRTEIKVIKY